MILTYRGIRYQNHTTAIISQRTKVKAKYRGQSYQIRLINWHSEQDARTPQTIGKCSGSVSLPNSTIRVNFSDLILSNSSASSPKKIKKLVYRGIPYDPNRPITNLSVAPQSVIKPQLV
ncbi:MAG: DUF4278 domain-containing protein [Halothece sp.]